MSLLNNSANTPVNVDLPVRPLIRDGVLIEDAWISVTGADELAALPADAAVLVPLALWQTLRQAESDSLLKRLQAGGAKLGVQLAPADEPGVLAGDVEKFALIAVEFPAFTDGRGYSTARLLRERYGYEGELRAVGDVQRDQLFAMVRCGFNAFVLRADKNPRDALASFGDFIESYQSAVDQPMPLFRRRAEAFANLILVDRVADRVAARAA